MRKRKSKYYTGLYYENENEKIPSSSATLTLQSVQNRVDFIFYFFSRRAVVLSLFDKDTRPQLWCNNNNNNILSLLLPTHNSRHSHATAHAQHNFVAIARELLLLKLLHSLLLQAYPR